MSSETPAAVPLSPFRELPAEAYVLMSWVLRAGLLIASAFLLGALVMFFAQHPAAQLSVLLGTNPISGYLSPASLGRGIVSGHPQAYLTLGVLVLVVTPLGRVLTGCWYFLHNEEREMALVSGTVLALLLFGLLVLGPFLR